MNYSTRTNHLGRKIIFSGFFLVVTIVHANVAIAAQEIVLVGFQIMPNGSITVKDPNMAVAPAGYHISRWGELVKNRQSLIKPIVEAKPEPEKPEPVKLKPVKPMKKVVVSEQQITIPPGFHRMGNGDIMANNPANAVVPPGFRLTPGGVLKLKTDLSPDPSPIVASETTMEFKQVPAGFHRMGDGTLMANNPSKAVAPDGYHLMPEGTIMATGSKIDHSKHTHKSGGMWMAENKQVRMYMNGMLDTTKNINAADVVNPGGSYNFPMAPTNMTMDMNMLMLMYHTRKYMVMSMLHYMSNDMGMVTNTGVGSTMASKGLGDTVVTVTVPWIKKFDYTVGVSLPTGSIDESGPMVIAAGVPGTDVTYTYGMQLGSGTYGHLY